MPSARPGARAPHLWLRDGRSILDLFGRGFTPLDFVADASDPSRLTEAAAARGVPLVAATVAEAEACDLYDCKLALVRPDGHVAWRCDGISGDASEVIDKTRGASR